MWLSDQMCHRIGIAFITTGAMLLLACLAQYFFGVVLFVELPAFPALGLVVVGSSLLVTAWVGKG